MFGWLGLETIATVLALAYVLCVMRENSLAWFFSFFSSGILVWINFDIGIYMSSALYVFFMFMAVYGWCQWHRGGNKQEGVRLGLWRFKEHLTAIGLILVLSLASGYLLSQNDDARLPYIDSFASWGSVVATFMVVRKIVENWLYWIVINLATIYMYIDAKTYQPAGLFILYLVLAVIGYLAWRKAYLEQQQPTS